MKPAMMKPSFIPIVLAALACATFNTSCLESEAAGDTKPARPPENGAQFKKGEGLSLTAEMRKAIDLRIEDVAEEKIASSVTLSLTAASPDTANGWLPPQQAARIQPGMEVELQGTPPFKGTVKSIEPNPPGVIVDSEITITTAEPLTVGTALKAVLRHPGGETVPVVPVSALLKTAEGTFVYAVNGKFYTRTPVTTGAANDKFVEIIDGLYSGDQVVTTPVMSLWMAELQVLRGGKACTCGH